MYQHGAHPHRHPTWSWMGRGRPQSRHNAARSEKRHSLWFGPKPAPPGPSGSTSNPNPKPEK